MGLGNSMAINGRGNNVHQGMREQNFPSGLGGAGRGMNSALTVVSEANAYGVSADAVLSARES